MGASWNVHEAASVRLLVPYVYYECTIRAGENVRETGCR